MDEEMEGEQQHDEKHFEENQEQNEGEIEEEEEPVVDQHQIEDQEIVPGMPADIDDHPMEGLEPDNT